MPFTYIYTIYPYKKKKKISLKTDLCTILSLKKNSKM